MGSGELFVMMALILMMLSLYVDNLDILYTVSQYILSQ